MEAFMEINSMATKDLTLMCLRDGLRMQPVRH